MHKSKSILAVLQLLLIVTIFIVSFYKNNFSALWETEYNKIINAVLLSCLLLVVAFEKVFKKTFRLSCSYIDVFIFLIAVVIFLSAFFQGNSFGVRYDFIYFPLLLGFYLLVKQLSVRVLLIVILGLAIIGLFGVGLGYLQYMGLISSSSHFFPIVGTFHNPGQFSGYLVIIFSLFCCFDFLIKNQQRSTTLRLLNLFFIVGIMSLLVLLNSRAAWLASLIVLIVLLKENYFKNRFNQIRKLYILLISALFIVIFVALYHYKIDSADGRLLIWKVCYTMWKENPFFGIGFGRFGSEYLNYQSLYFLNNLEEYRFAWLADNVYYAFNELVQLVVELGFAGGLLLLTLAYFIMKAKTRTMAPSGSFVFITSKYILCALMTFALFSYPFRNMAIFPLVVFFLAILSKNAKQVIVFKFYHPFNWIAKLLLIISIVGLSFMLSKSYLIYNAIEVWENASYEIKGDRTAFENYEKVYPILCDNGVFLYNYGAELSENEQYEESIKVLEQSKVYFNHSDLYVYLGNNYRNISKFEKAEAHYTHACNMVPNRIYPKYQLLKLYEFQKKRQQAIKMAFKIDTMKIKTPNRFTKKIKEEIKRAYFD